MEGQKFTPEVFIRLLVAKGLLDQIRFNPTAHPDRVTLARQILTAHDAAELAAAAIAQQLGKLPKSQKTFLMDYISSIKESHPEKDAAGRDYFSQLNQVRIDIKHLGIFPDPRQWYRVGERTWEYVSGWCQDYLGRSLEDLDESSLIYDSDVKKHYDSAVEAFGRNDYKETLERLAFATEALFNSNRALRNLSVGISRAEDAIKLAAFGVHANDYLALQEFLPNLVYNKENELVVKWEQKKYGHPVNWRNEAAAFCLKTFVNVALRIQDANWIPGAIDFDIVYEHKVTALIDGVEITQEPGVGLARMMGQRFVVRTLKKGEFILGTVTRNDTDRLVAQLQGKEIKPVFNIIDTNENLWGEVEADKVRVTCVPKDNDIVRKYFPGLAEIDFKP